MNWNRVWALVKKDVKEFTKSKYVMSVIIIMPLFFALFYPIVAILPMTKIDPAEFGEEGLGPFIDNIFGQILSNWGTIGSQAQTLVMISYAMFITVLLLPVIIPAVTASETVVGEKERKTMEAIIASPITEEEIVLAKIISSFLPSVIGTLVSSIGYIIAVDIILYPYIGSILFPDLISVMLVLVFSPMISIIAVELMIMISTRVTTVRDSYQIGSLAVLPLIMLIAAEMFGMLFNSLLTMLVGISILAIVIFFLFKVAARIFDRERALIKLV